VRPQAYYNENDPHACAWLQGLMDQGLIMAGKIDNRSIYDVSPDDVKKFTRVGFFAGIGGWDLALQLAGWPADRPVWHGSCPCQPFSVAGKGKGSDDERHLWPAFFNLIRECRPDVVFGEQVESAVGHGWLDSIRADLEGEGYACGDCTMGAHSAGADHQRQRLYWVANSGKPQREKWEECNPARGETSWRSGERFTLERTDGHMADRVPTDGAGFDHWSRTIWIYCRDGKHRRVSTFPSLFPLASRLPYNLARRGSIRPALLKGAGNAIVPQVAAMFIEAFDGAELL
jgi:DNA (cytosine-5)-methyltransferase 1